MLGTLIESQAAVQRHSVGSVVSVVVHTALVASIVGAAGKTTAALRPRPFEIIHVALPPTPPHRDPNPAHAVQTTVPAVPRMPTIRLPSIVPTEIPAIDLTSEPVPGDVIERWLHPRGEVCAYPCPQPVGGDETSAPPVWAIKDVMMQLRERPVPPRYPEVLRRAGIDGNVVMRFVVDTLGRVDPASVEVLSSSHDLFTAAVRETLTRLRFNPSKVGDRKVRAAAMMPFHFTLK